MMNGDRKEGICRLNVDGNGCDYLRILSDLETKLRNNTNPKEKIELALQGALMFYDADRAYVIEVDDELGIGVNTYVVANRDGDPLSYTQFKRVWQYIVTRSTKERTYVRYINGQKIQRTVTPKLGEKAAHNGNVVYTLDFQVTPHQLRHTYITNLIYSGADPKTVQYLAGHKHSKITMDIYAKVKYNKPKELSSVVNKAFAPKKGATPNKTRNG